MDYWDLIEDSGNGVDKRSNTLELLALDEHPRYLIKWRTKSGGQLLLNPASASEFKQARLGSGLDMRQAAKALGTSKRVISRYEKESEPNKPGATTWALFALIAGIHPQAELLKREV